MKKRVACLIILQIVGVIIMLVLAFGITYVIASSDIPLWLKFLILK